MPVFVMAGSSIRVGVLGAGSVVRSLHLPVLRALPGVEIVWIADRDVEAARGAARTFGIPRAGPVPDEFGPADVVLVAVPVGARRAALERILGRGEHAFCEKPFAPTLADHEWMLSAARTAGRRVGVALVRRVYGSTVLARELLRSGVLGPIVSVSAGEGARVQRTGREADWYQGSAVTAGGGVLMETGPHLVDQVATICEVRSFSVERCAQETDSGLDFDTIVRGTLEPRSGERVPFAFELSRLRDVFNGIVVRCAHGELRIGLGVDSPVEVAGPAGPPVRLHAPGPHDAVSAFAQEWQGFLARLRAGDGIEEDTGSLTTALIDACYTLARSTAPA